MFLADFAYKASFVANYCLRPLDSLRLSLTVKSAKMGFLMGILELFGIFWLILEIVINIWCFSDGLFFVAGGGESV